MQKHSTLWFSLCLSCLVANTALVAATSIKTIATPHAAIAQTNPCAGKNPCASKTGKLVAPVMLDEYLEYLFLIHLK